MMVLHAMRGPCCAPLLPSQILITQCLPLRNAQSQRVSHKCALRLPRDARKRCSAPSGQEEYEWSPSDSEGPRGLPRAALQPGPSANRSRPPGRTPAGPPHIIVDSSDEDGSARPRGGRNAARPHVISDTPNDKERSQAGSKRARHAADLKASVAGSSSRASTAPDSPDGLGGGAVGMADLQPLQAAVHAAQVLPAMRLAELRERAHAAGPGAGPPLWARVHGRIQTLLGGLVFRDEEGRPASEYFLALTVADAGGDEADAAVSSVLLQSLLGAPPWGFGKQMTTAVTWQLPRACLHECQRSLWHRRT